MKTLAGVFKFIVAIFVILIVIGSCMPSDDNDNDNDTKQTEISEQKKDEKEKEVKESNSKKESSNDKKKILAKLSENSTISGAKELNKQGELVVLNSGKWTVGKNIKPGHYQITASSGQGNVMGDTKGHLNIMLAATPDENNMYLSKYDTYLFEGDKIDIRGLQGVTFTPIREGLDISSGEVTAGNYVVGLDIKPGRYKIKAITGNGNLMVDDGSVNEMFGTDTSDGIYISETTQELEEGQVLTTTLNSISLIKE